MRNTNVIINQNENEWKEIFDFALIHIVGVALVLNTFSTLTMFSLGAGAQVSSIYQAALPITFILAIWYSFFVGRKIQNYINLSKSWFARYAYINQGLQGVCFTNWCCELGSNQWHLDFQSNALPTELPQQNILSAHTPERVTNEWQVAMPEIDVRLVIPTQSRFCVNAQIGGCGMDSNLRRINHLVYS